MPQHTPSKRLYYHDHCFLFEKIGDHYQFPSFTIEPHWLKLSASFYALGFYQDLSLSTHLAEIQEPLPEPYEWLSLRKALESLSPQWHAALSRAYQIVNWDYNHRYCGRCGSETEHSSANFERRCPQCELLFYPRISPSIIVLIQKGKEILLARKAQFPEGIYGLIAGFVEVGETIEETVHREVHEEVGLRVKNVVYQGSQSWPFPDSLMLAFKADYESGEIELLDGELEIAGWYDVDHLPGLPSTSVSIARKLIDDWISEH